MSTIAPIRPRQRSAGALRLFFDAVAIIGTLVLVKYFAPGWFDTEAVVAALTGSICFFVVGHVTGLYRVGHDLTANQEIVRVNITWAFTVLILAALAFYFRFGQYFARSVIMGWTVLAPVVVSFLRMTWRIIHRVRIKQGMGTRSVGIVGCNELGIQVSQNIDRNPGLGLVVRGFYDDRDANRLPLPDSPPLLGTVSDLIQCVKANEVDIVLISLPLRAEDRTKHILEQLRDSTASVYVVPDFFVFEMLHSQWTNIGGIPAISVFESPLYGVDGIAKRVVDVSLAISALVVAAVPMLAIMLAIKLTSKGPIFFRQKRYGMDGCEIKVWKFRSMTTCDDGKVIRQATKNDTRITPLGAVLRKTSLDELPQLFNVLNGSMSLVGPRPHATAHNEEYRRLIRGYMLRHKIKPGITGLAQVEGCRGETDTLDKMQRRVDYDHRYIREWSLWLDLKILIKTLWVAWRQPEAY